MSIFRIYGPVIVIVVMSVLQTIVLLVQLELEKRHKTLPLDDWFDDSVWDDVACSIACSSILCCLCYIGATDWAWAVMAPVILLGSASTTYHFFQIGIDTASQGL